MPIYFYHYYSFQLAKTGDGKTCGSWNLGLKSSIRGYFDTPNFNVWSLPFKHRTCLTFFCISFTFTTIVLSINMFDFYNIYNIVFVKGKVMLFTLKRILKKNFWRCIAFLSRFRFGACSVNKRIVREYILWWPIVKTYLLRYDSIFWANLLTLTVPCNIYTVL